MDTLIAACILGLPSDRPAPEDLRTAWRRFARENHPDRRPGDPTAARRFSAGREAYETLRPRAEAEGRAGSERPRADRGDAPRQERDGSSARRRPRPAGARRSGTAPRTVLRGPAARYAASHDFPPVAREWSA